MILSLLLTLASYADTQPAHYELQNLKPVSFSQYNESSLNRLYLDFQNELGTHHVVYEEVSGMAPIKDMNVLREVLTKGDHSCELEILCQAKAFCTGDCKNMYYEFTNAATVTPDRNRCTLRYFSCEKGLDFRLPASVPSSAPTPTITPTSAPTDHSSDGLNMHTITNLKENVKKMEADPLAGQNFEE